MADTQAQQHFIGLVRKIADEKEDYEPEERAAMKQECARMAREFIAAAERGTVPPVVVALFLKDIVDMEPGIAADEGDSCALNYVLGDQVGGSHTDREVQRLAKMQFRSKVLKEKIEERRQVIQASR